MSSLRGVDGLPPVLDEWPNLEVFFFFFITLKPRVE